jgi:hypothetical protein
MGGGSEWDWHVVRTLGARLSDNTTTLPPHLTAAPPDPSTSSLSISTHRHTDTPATRRFIYAPHALAIVAGVGSRCCLLCAGPPRIRLCATARKDRFWTGRWWLAAMQRHCSRGGGSVMRDCVGTVIVLVAPLRGTSLHCGRLSWRCACWHGGSSVSLRLWSAMACVWCVRLSLCIHRASFVSLTGTLSVDCGDCCMSWFSSGSHRRHGQAT